MYQRILIPVDVSDTAKRALQEVARLSVDQHARHGLVHVVENPYAYLLDEIDLDQIEKAWRAARGLSKEIRVRSHDWYSGTGQSLSVAQPATHSGHRSSARGLP